MELSTALLVILMFVAVVGIGIGTILTTFASIVAQFKSLRRHRLGLLWLLILLVSYLSMFWNCTLLTERENWTFALFLYVVAGPVILLFASSLMAALLDQEPKEGGDEHWESVLSRFFWLYAASHAWFVGMDFVLGFAWSNETTLSAVLTAIAILLAVVSSIKLRWYFTIAMFLLVIAELVMEGVLPAG